MTGAPGASASSGLNTAASSSYSISMKLSVLDGGFAVDGGHGRHSLADITHFLTRQNGLVLHHRLDRQIGKILPGDDSLDARRPAAFATS